MTKQECPTSKLDEIRSLCEAAVTNQDGSWVDAESIERILDAK